ncbi:MAG: cytochrome c [Bradyrhizobium sp.]|uniref:c-type cytochrome n=1 Tax=Bradyrhizobium sp. TaxID=376 RepID=UPI0025BABB20|nr:cytochrome c [Bradyrhizobium sp.]MBI5264141.1 cytochrome c [Bradyrhizobium sp.]
MLCRFTSRALLVMALSLGVSAAAQAATTKELRSRGKAILEEKCSRCHAVGTRDLSPLKGAPPMRTIYGRFAPKELRAEIQEGMVSRHREMPQIDFSDEDTDAIMAYLYALALRK